MKYEQLTFQPMSRPTNVVSPRRSTATTSPRSTPGVLHHEVAGLERDGHPVRPEVARDDARVCVEVHGSLAVAGDAAHPSPDVDLADRAAGLQEPIEEPGRVDERHLEPVELVAQPAGPGVEVQRVDDEPVAADRIHRVVEPLLGDTELGRPLAGVGEVLRVAGAGPGLTRMPTVRPGARRPTLSSWLTPSRLRRIGCASSTSRSRSDTFVPVWLIASALQPFARACSTSPGEQASMPMPSGVPGSPIPRRTARILGSGQALSAKRVTYGTPARAIARWSARTFSTGRARS